MRSFLVLVCASASACAADSPSDNPAEAADTALADEVCDGEDNDGDGDIDEDYVDDDGNGRVDCLDQECPALDLGDAGVVDIVPACAANGATPAPDLFVEITDRCVADCTYGPAKLAVQVANQGGMDVASGVILSIYAVDDDAWFRSAITLPAIASGERLAGVEIALEPGDVGSGGAQVRIDDDGHGAGVVSECNETNNVAALSDVSCE